MTRKLLRGALPAAAALIVLALPAGSLYYEYNAGASCARCHEIRTHYDAWHASSHRDVTCGACHGEITTLDAGFHWGNLRRLITSHLYVAVSKTADPTGDYNIYVMETTNQGHIGCPCIADYAQPGSDQYGFHIAFNEFNSNTFAYVDAAILTLSKAALVNGAPAPTAYQFLLPYNTGYEFAIQPAATPPGAANFVASGGLEFFASTLSRSAFNGGVALWAMRNTRSMATSSPNPILSQIVISTLSYTFPDVANQRPGPLPYGWSLIPTGQLAFFH